MPQGSLHAYGIRSVGAIGAAAASVVLFAAPAGEADRAATGGAAYESHPKVESVKCTARCASHGHGVHNGGIVRLRGADLAGTRKVLFLGGAGRADDASVTVEPSSDRVLSVKVPYQAASGPVSVWASKRARSKPTKPLAIVPARPPEETGRLTPATGPAEQGAPSLQTSTSSGVVFAGGSDVSFRYRIDGGGPASVVVKVVQVAGGAVMRTWRADGVKPGDTQELTWAGRSGDGDAAAPDGRYAFRMTATGPSGATARNANDGDDERDAFDFHGYVFPLRAHHTYGDGFGAPRSGHRHEGQDVFADCGVPIYAARGGTVKDNKYQSAAGNYIVIDGAGTGYDFFYAHLRSPSPLKVGEHVDTGQRIGNVGDTGDAVGCHLHFEIWSPPGWYSGGHPFDPAPLLRDWDRYS